MRHGLLAFLLAGLATGAAAQRVSLELPVSPTPQVLVAPALFNTLPTLSPFGAEALKPSLSAPSLLAPNLLAPTLAAPVVANGLSPVSPVAPALPKALVPSALAPASISRAIVPVTPAKTPGGGAKTEKVIDSLREHGALAGKLSTLQGEEGAGALERNFMSAAALGDRNDAVDGKREDHSKPQNKLDLSLYERLLEKVRLDDRGKPEEKKALEDAFKRMISTPTGKRLAEQFLAEGVPARIQFQEFPDSQLYEIGGRKRFFAAQAYTDWNQQDGTVVVRLNRHYIDGDPDYMHQTLPWVMGHELLGHGLWYARASKENLYLAYHYHELNETLARTVGWAIDHELDGRFDESAPWQYLQDPAHYLASLKTLIAYYAVTFSGDEMADAIGSMRKRLVGANQNLLNARANLQNQQTWIPVLDHFSSGHGYDTKRFALLRTELTDLVRHYESNAANAETIVAEVSGLISRMEAEPNGESQDYLRAAAQHAFFSRLEKELDGMTKHLRERIAAHPQAQEPTLPAAARPADQYTWADLMKMYQDDVAADATRSAKHWH